MTKNMLDRDPSFYDEVAASDKPYPLAILNADGTEDGLVLDILGSQSEKVQAEVNRLVNDRRKRKAQAAAVAKGEPLDFTPVEDDISFGHRLTAVRVVGWNLKAPFSAEAAYRLVSRSARISEQVTAASNDLGNFTSASSGS